MIVKVNRKNDQLPLIWYNHLAHPSYTVCDSHSDLNSVPKCSLFTLTIKQQRTDDEEIAITYLLL